MNPGIDPKVDFAFKMVAGSPEHPKITIHFLNAVIQPIEPITSVTILNPIQERVHAAAKLAILDILAEDANRSRYNVEMQTTVPGNLRPRLIFYNCQNYVRQLSSGAAYQRLCPSISICVSNRLLFDNSSDYHLSFRLRCDQRNLVFSDDLSFHTLELPNYAIPDDNVWCGLPDLEKWLIFLKEAAHRDVDELARLLDDEIFSEAGGVLKMIARTPDDRQFYEDRIQFLHDEESRIIATREQSLEEGMKQGVKHGIEQGIKQGVEQGIKQGVEQGIKQGVEQGIKQGVEQGIKQGIAKGSVAGKIQLLHQLLGETEVAMPELLQLGDAKLASMLAELQDRLRARGS